MLTYRKEEDRNLLGAGRINNMFVIQTPRLLLFSKTKNPSHRNGERAYLSLEIITLHSCSVIP
jgi:hypothetical protein